MLHLDHDVKGDKRFAVLNQLVNVSLISKVRGFLLGIFGLFGDLVVYCVGAIIERYQVGFK